MRYLLTLLLLGIVIAGCSSQSSASPSAKKAPPDNPDIANIAPEKRTTEEAAPSEPASSLPIITANSTPIVLTPIQGDTPESSPEPAAPAGNWQTFSSASLGVVVNYPPDWSVAEAADHVTFTAPNGATIQLKADTANANNKEFKIGNRYCTSRTNEHGQVADICVSHASFIYTAKFSLQNADGSTHWVTLMTTTRTVGDVFEGMFNSLQSTN